MTDIFVSQTLIAIIVINEHILIALLLTFHIRCYKLSFGINSSLLMDDNIIECRCYDFPAFSLLSSISFPVRSVLSIWVPRKLCRFGDRFPVCMLSSISKFYASSFSQWCFIFDLLSHYIYHIPLKALSSFLDFICPWSSTK